MWEDDLIKDFLRMRKYFDSVNRELLGIEDKKYEDYRKAWIDVRETETEYLIAAELPGIEKEDIDLQISSNYLSIKAEKRKEKREENKEKGKYFYAKSYAGFVRTIPLPENIERDKIKAEFKNGVLKIHIPKTKDARKSKQIKIS